MFTSRKMFFERFKQTLDIYEANLAQCKPLTASRKDSIEGMALGKPNGGGGTGD